MAFNNLTEADMEQLKLSSPLDFSEASVEDAMILFGGEVRFFKLIVSMNDSKAALTMLSCEGVFREIHSITVTQDYSAGGFMLINIATGQELDARQGSCGSNYRSNFNDNFLKGVESYFEDGYNKLK